MRLLLPVLFSFMVLFSHAQTLEQWNALREKLLHRQSMISDSLSTADAAIRRLTADKIRKEPYRIATLKWGASLTKEPLNWASPAETIEWLKAGDTVRIVSVKMSAFVKVWHESQLGWLRFNDLNRSPELDKYLEVLDAIWYEEINKPKTQPKTQPNTNRYGIGEGTVTTFVDGIEVNRVNLWSSTSEDRTLKCFLKHGAKVTILKDADEYYLVAGPNGCQGYCMKGFIVSRKMY